MPVQRQSKQGVPHRMMCVEDTVQIRSWSFSEPDTPNLPLTPQASILPTTNSFDNSHQNEQLILY